MSTAVDLFSAKAINIGDLVIEDSDGNYHLTPLAEKLPCMVNIQALSDTSYLLANKACYQYYGFANADEWYSKARFQPFSIVQQEDLKYAETMLQFLQQYPEQAPFSSLLLNIKLEEESRQLLTNVCFLDSEHFLSISIDTSDLGDEHPEIRALRARAALVRENVTRFEALSKREIEICKLLCSERTPAQIGAVLEIAANTVHRHKERIYKKLDINNLFELFRFCEAFNLKTAPQQFKLI